MGRYKSRELLHFGIDYFKCFIDIGKNKKLALSPNSNISFYDEFTFLELLPDGYTKDYKKFYAIKDKKTNINLGFIGSGADGSGFIKRNDFLEITGQGLILRGGFRYWVHFCEKMNLNIIKYIRVDICIDIEVDTEYFIREILKDYLAKKTKTFFDTKGIRHAVYIGEKQLCKNTYQFIRIYNKKLDNIVKNKEWLYTDYNKYGEITRLEVEIRRDKAEFLTTNKLLDINYIFAICVKAFYCMNNQFFSFFDIEDFKKVVEKNGLWKKRQDNKKERKYLQDLYGCSFKNLQELRVWKATFLSYAKRLFINGISKDQLFELININLTAELAKNNEKK